MSIYLSIIIIIVLIFNFKVKLKSKYYKSIKFTVAKFTVKFPGFAKEEAGIFWLVDEDVDDEADDDEDENGAADEDAVDEDADDWDLGPFWWFE